MFVINVNSLIIRSFRLYQYRSRGIRSYVIKRNDDIIQKKSLREQIISRNNDNDNVNEKDNDNDMMRNNGKNKVEAGHVYYVATPLGNLGDITIRAKTILSEVDYICAEDTRTTSKLLSLLGLGSNSDNKVKAKLISHHEHNWQTQIPYIRSLLKDGNSIAVVSDAGTPGISDPGAELAAALSTEQVVIHPIPGPSAVIAALSISGFSASEFTFLGFLAAKGKERKEKLESIVSITHTVVFYEAPHRVVETFKDILNQNKLSENRLCICCRELTKLHEEIRRGTISDCYNWLLNQERTNGKIKGEFTIVLGPIQHEYDNDKDDQIKEQQDIIELLKKYRNDNIPRSEAVKLLSDQTNMKKSHIYKLALDIDW